MSTQEENLAITYLAFVQALAVQQQKQFRIQNILFSSIFLYSTERDISLTRYSDKVVQTLKHFWYVVDLVKIQFSLKPLPKDATYLYYVQMKKKWY